MGKKINEKKRKKRDQAINLKCIQLLLLKSGLKYDTSVRVLTYKTVSNSARNSINVNKL